MARFVDVDGEPIGMAPATIWHASDSAIASVDSTGRVIAHGGASNTGTGSSRPWPAGRARPTPPAPDPEGYGTGKPAPTQPSMTHGTFLLVEYRGHFYWCLTYVSVDRILGTGDTPKAYLRKIGDTPQTLYAVSDMSGMVDIVPTWDQTVRAPSDSGLVRLVQASDAQIVYLRPPGAPLTQPPELCYFDIGGPPEYFSLPAGAFDLIFQQKPSDLFDSTAAFVRTLATASGGHAVTLGLVGYPWQSTRYLAFADN